MNPGQNLPVKRCRYELITERLLVVADDVVHFLDSKALMPQFRKDGCDVKIEMWKRKVQ